MATWKKVVVSGSAAELASVSASYLYSSTQLNIGTNQNITTSTAQLSGSFSGSFSGNGSNLTGITAVTASYADTLDGLDRKAFVQIAGTQTVTGAKTFREVVTLGVSGASDGQLDLVESTSAKKISLQVQDSTADLSFLDNGGSPLATLYNNGDGLELVSGDFIGNLSGNATSATTASYVLNAVSSSYANSVMWNNVSAKPVGLVSESIAGTSQGQIKVNGVDVNVTGLQTTSNPTFGNLIVTGDLTVQGTTTTINTDNLLVEDKFALFASGSTTGTDGGIVIQSAAGATPSGYAYGYKTTEDRWAYQDSLNYNATTFGTPTAWATTTEYGLAASRPANPSYGGASYGYGNIWVSTDTGEIWIYS